MLPSTPLAVDELTEELVSGPAHRRGSIGGQVSGAATSRRVGGADFLEIERAGERLLASVHRRPYLL